MKKYRLRETFKKTSDEWCPSYHLEDGTAVVNVMTSGPMMRVSGIPYYVTVVSGGDDMMMGFESADADVAEDIFYAIIDLEDVTVDSLLAIGLSRD